MTDTDPTTEEPTTEPTEEPTPPSYSDILAMLGFPGAKSVVITSESVVAIDANYPEPYTLPTEA